MNASTSPTTSPTSEDLVGGRRRPGGLRDHRRPGQGDDLPLALPAGAARPARLPDRRRGGRRLVAGAAGAARPRLDRGHRRSARRGGVRAVRRPTGLRARATSATPPPTSGWARRSAAPSIRCSTSRSRRSCSGPGRQGTGRGRAHRARRGSWSRSRSVTTSSRRRRWPPNCTSTSTRRSSTGSTTTSGRWASRRSSTCASPTRSSNRCGTAATSSACRSRWPRTSASTIAVTSTTRSVRCATWWSTTSCRWWRRPRWSRPPAGTRKRCGMPQVALFRPSRRPTPPHYVRGQYDGYLDIDGVAAGLDDRDLCRAAARDRQLAVVGRAVLHPDRQASSPSPRPRCASSSASRRRCTSGSAPARADRRSATSS